MSAHCDTPVGESTLPKRAEDEISSVTTVDPYKPLFEWLWKCEVRKIFTLEVDDNGPEPHTNAAIRQALRGSEPETNPSRDFGIEVWKWKKFDICSETVIAAAPSAKHVHLYSRGNTAVLRGWASGSDWSRMQQVVDNLKMASNFRLTIVQLKSLTVEIFPQVSHIPRL
jgi:hypothetical protein